MLGVTGDVPARLDRGLALVDLLNVLDLELLEVEGEAFEHHLVAGGSPVLTLEISTFSMVILR